MIATMQGNKVPTLVVVGTIATGVESYEQKLRLGASGSRAATPMASSSDAVRRHSSFSPMFRPFRFQLQRIVAHASIPHTSPLRLSESLLSLCQFATGVTRARRNAIAIIATVYCLHLPHDLYFHC